MEILRAPLAGTPPILVGQPTGGIRSTRFDGGRTPPVDELIKGANRRTATTPGRLPSPGASPLVRPPAGSPLFNPRPGIGSVPMNTSIGDHVRRTADRLRTPTSPNRPAQPAQATPPAFPSPVPTGDPTGFGGGTGFGPGENLIGTQFNLPTTTREELVQRMFQASVPEMDRQAALRREGLGRQIAGLGRGGMGGVNTAFGTLESLESQQRSELLGRLSAGAAEGDINDLFRRGEFGQRERQYQNQLDLQAQQSEQGIMQALQQLGFSFDPVNNPNLTNALIGEQRARSGSAANTQGSFADLAGNLASTIPFLI